MNNKIKIGINGFGRIGRIAARIIMDKPNLEITAINSRSDAGSHAYLLKYDSSYGISEKNINSTQGNLYIDKDEVKVYQFDDPEDIPWDKAKVDIVIDATGKFTKNEDLKHHLGGSVKFVVLSSPAKDEMKTIVMGVNEKLFDPKTDKVVSNSSCTTNCLATTLKVLEKEFGVTQAFMTTIHAVTDSQNLLDNSHKKETRLRRAAFLSMIPSTTGSARDIAKIFPSLNGKIICQSIRVPLSTVSMILLTAQLNKKADIGLINEKYKYASETYLKNILSVTKDELVSKDFTGNSCSSVVDTFLTKVLDGSLISISAWYDNEWGYTSRLIDLVEFISNKAKIA